MMDNNLEMGANHKITPAARGTQYYKLQSTV